MVRYDGYSKIGGELKFAFEINGKRTLYKPIGRLGKERTAKRIDYLLTRDPNRRKIESMWVRASGDCIWKIVLKYSDGLRITFDK